MTAWYKGFVSPGLCSGICFLLWWRAWKLYCSYGKSKLWLLMCFSRVYYSEWQVKEIEVEFLCPFPCATVDRKEFFVLSALST